MIFNIGSLIQITQEQLLIALTLSLPLVIATSASGLLIGLIQAVTQIQDQTVQFLVKIIVFAAVLALTGHWMMTTLVNYAQNLIMQI